jgi:formylmethanofuran dehydrogenase subunit D
MPFLFNTGRTIGQGSAIERKMTEAYARETSTLRMNPLDMMTLEISDQDTVRVTSPVGSVILSTVGSEETDPGTVFLPLGPYANSITPAETHGTGMPDFKSFLVEIKPTPERVPGIPELMRMCGGTGR